MNAQVGPDRILELSRAFREAKVLLSAVELSVFTVLSDGGLDLETLRKKTSVAERGARDFFDALVALDLLERDEDGRYSNTTETAFYLDANKRTYIGQELIYFGERIYPHWNLLTPALKTGTPQSDNAADYFQSLYADQTSLKKFVSGMTGGSRLAAQSIAEAFAWGNVRTFADIGTAEGCLPVEIAQAHSHLEGVGFDLPQVQPVFDQYVHQHGLQHRLKFCPGNFLSDPLPQADVLVMGRILHNWDLPTKKMLLRKAHEAVATGGALLVYERLIDDDRRSNVAGLLASLHMLIMTEGGFDFTAADCIGWMRETGFRDIEVHRLKGDTSMIVGLK
jgi:hypothetical protein